MKKLTGGILHYWSANMAPIVLTPKHLAAIRSGAMAERWFAKVADASWANARESAIRDLKARLRAEASMELPVVDRRPTKVKLL